MHLKPSVPAQGTSGEFKGLFSTFSGILAPAELHDILMLVSHAQIHRLIGQGLLKLPQGIEGATMVENDSLKDSSCLSVVSDLNRI